MSESFNIIVHPYYPKLGWLFVIDDHPTLHAGNDVEVFANGFVEGCWDADFSRFDFYGRMNFYGSGATRREDNWYFCPPSHTLDALYAIVHKDRTYVSNSLLLLTEYTNLHLDAKVNYTKAIASVVYGLDKADTILCKNADFTLYRVVADDFMFHEGRLYRFRRTEAKTFTDFNSYCDYLLETISICARNATDSARRRTYRLVSTCSGGYDSNTATALSAAIGGALALTLQSARGGGADSGRPIAEALGLECIERGRAERGDNSLLMEFLACGTGGGDYPLAVFEAELSDTLLLTGFHGDKIWERTVSPNPVLKRGDVSGCSLADFRLRVGFLHIPVPFIGARKHAEIYAISNSKEMRSFSVGGTYDRPICRRILEEAGVPRDYVGRSKNAVAILFAVSPHYLSEEFRLSFENYLRRRGMLWTIRVKLMAFLSAAIGFRIIRKVTRVAPILEQPLGGLREIFYKHFGIYENSSYANMMFIWALEQMISHIREKKILMRQSDRKGESSN